MRRGYIYAYSVHLPLHNGKDAILRSLQNLTAKLPFYSLSKIEEGVRENAKVLVNSRCLRIFRKLPNKVGGEPDIQIGIKYSKYFPEEI